MENKDLGFICLFRDFLGWPWYLDINTKVLFVHMLLKANWKEGRFREITVPRGSFVSSYPHLAEECGLTINELRTALNHLKSTGEITVKASSKYSVFTVNNYCKYQDINIQYDIQSTGGAHSINRPLTTIKQRNKGTKKQNLENIINDISCSEPENSAPIPSGILLPLVDKSFYDVPQEKIALWRETYPAVDVEQELRRMIAWLDSNPTKRKTGRGVDRFINSWLARTQDSGGSKVQREVEPVGNNAFNSDARWQQISRAIDEAGDGFDGRNDLPFR